MLRSLKDLQERPDDLMKDVGMVTMGINPSARELHQGHYITLYQFARILNAHSKVDGICYVDDRELDLKRCVLSQEHLYRVPLAKTALEIRQKISDALSSFSQELNDLSIIKRTRIIRMSEWCRHHSINAPETNGMKLYSLIQKNRKLLQEIFEPSPENTQSTPLLRTACSECGTGTRLDNADTYFVKNAIMDLCLNNECSSYQNPYTVSPQNGDGLWTIFYPVDPLRDAILSRDRKQKVLHVFGGDYGLAWGESGVPKVQRLSKAIQLVAPDADVDHYVGPMLLRNGKKLSKSNGDQCVIIPATHELERLLHAGETDGVRSVTLA